MDIGAAWETLLKVVAGLIVFFEFGKWVISFGNPIVKLRETAEELKKRLDKHDELFANDKSHLEKIDSGVSQIDEGLSVLGRAISEMMKHEITGNDIEALKEQQKKVNDYFFNRGKIDEN